MSDEPSVKDRFDEVEGLRFYGIIRIKSEIRKQGADPKYTDKSEATLEVGFTANSLEELKTKSKSAITAILENQAAALGVKE